MSRATLAAMYLNDDILTQEYFEALEKLEKENEDAQTKKD